MSAFWKRLSKQVKRHPYRTLVSTFLVYAAAWTLLEPLVSFLTPTLGAERYIALLVLVLVFGVGRMGLRRTATIKLPSTNTIVRVAEGDLVAFPHHRIVSANEYFDCQLGQHVARESIHGQIIDRQFGGSAELFEREVDRALVGVGAVEMKRSSGRTKQYPIGTIAPVQYGPNLIFLAALSRTDVETLKANATSDDLWLVLNNVWETVRLRGNGRPVALALMGTGNSGINWPYAQVLELILLSLLDASKRNATPTTEIHVLAPVDVIASLDLRAIEEVWKK